MNGAFDGKGSHSVKRIKYLEEVALYVQYDGKYGDSETAFIVNEDVLNNLIQHIESTYKEKDIKVFSSDAHIIGNFSTQFYDFVEIHYNKQG